MLRNWVIKDISKAEFLIPSIKELFEVQIIFIYLLTHVIIGGKKDVIIWDWRILSEKR